MEKLSGILPTNGRIKSVDLKKSHPVRPGVVRYGQPEGANTIRDKMTISSRQNLAAAAAETLLYKNPKEARQAKIASDISEKFFATRLEEPANEATSEAALDSTEEISDMISGDNSPDVAMSDVLPEAGEYTASQALDPAETEISG